jgi:hypothetical protein
MDSNGLTDGTAGTAFRQANKACLHELKKRSPRGVGEASTVRSSECREYEEGQQEPERKKMAAKRWEMENAELGTSSKDYWFRPPKITREIEH